MLNVIEEKLTKLREEEDLIRAEREELKAAAVAEVQKYIDAFSIKAEELSFAGEEKVVAKRAPSKPMYVLPNGVTWSGKGRIKKEVKDYLEENNLTEDDLVNFLNPERK